MLVLHPNEGSIGLVSAPGGLAGQSDKQNIAAAHYPADPHSCSLVAVHSCLLSASPPIRGAGESKLVILVKEREGDGGGHGSRTAEFSQSVDASVGILNICSNHCFPHTSEQSMHRRLKKPQIGQRQQGVEHISEEYTLASLPSDPSPASSCSTAPIPAASSPVVSQPVLRRRRVSYISESRTTWEETPRSVRLPSAGMASATNTLAFTFSSWMQSLLELGRQGVAAIRDFFPRVPRPKAPSPAWYML